MILEDVFAETEKLAGETMETRYYFVSCHTINGARFYSEPFEGSFDALETFEDYKGLCDYFGGGVVELFRIDDIDFDIIAVARI